MNSNRLGSQRLRQRRLLIAASAGLASWSIAAAQALAAGSSAQGLRRGFGDIRIGGRQAGAGEQLRSGDRITTGPGAHALVVVDADAFLLRANSALEMEQQAGKRILRYLSGRVLSVFGKGEKQLMTPTATIGIRGTACYIEAAPLQTYFCLCYGSADVAALTAPAAIMRVSTKHHERPLIIEANQSIMRAAEVINHTDAELIMLEHTVGRQPAFGKAGVARY